MGGHLQVPSTVVCTTGVPVFAPQQDAPKPPGRTMPKLISPPKHLLPDDVQRARKHVERWTLFSIVLWSTWVLGAIAGTIPLVVHLVEAGWMGSIAPALALYLGLPATWAAARTWRSKLLRSDRLLLQQWGRFPADGRWSSSLVLADQMDRSSGGDPEVRATLQRMVGALFGLFTELAALDQSIAADREIAELGGNPEIHRDLVTLRGQRDAQITRLVDALRELHLGLARRHAAPPAVRAEVAALLDQLDAEREVDGLRPARDSVRLARVRSSIDAG